MSLYEANITKVEYKPRVERVPDALSGELLKKTTFPLMVSVTFRSQERGLPGFDQPLVEEYEFDELREKAVARLAEFERKGALFLSLRETLKATQIIALEDLVRGAKPEHENNSPYPLTAEFYLTDSDADTAHAPA